jgi:protoheme IX farnesyltransferase
VSEGDASGLRRTALGLVKACHPGPVAAVTAASIAMARVFGGRRRDALRVGTAVLAGQLAIGWQNDWVDAERDRLAARSDKPLPADLLTRETLGAAALLAAAVCLPTSAALSRRGALAHLVAVASAVSYNAGLKRTPLSILTYAVSFGLLPVVAHDAWRREDTTPEWAVAAGAFMGMSAHLVNVLPDREADRELGVMGFPQRLSADASLALAAMLLVGASGSIAFGTAGVSRRTVRLCGLSCAASGAMVLAGRRCRGRMAFRLFLINGLAQVALVARALPRERQ